MLLLEQRYFLADHNLNYTDKMSMAAGVEVRVPFLDPDLVALAARIPDSYRQKGGQGKWILKKAMAGVLPREIIYRRKTGFGVPLRAWLRGQLKPMLHDLLGTESLRRRGLFRSALVSKMVQDNDVGRADHAYTLLSLMCVELWCRQFVDCPGGGLLGASE
jgi:asparagine synthase (glutamine-hydrolysing)